MNKRFDLNMPVVARHQTNFIAWSTIATCMLALIIWLAGWTGPGNPSAAADAIWVLLTSTPLALVWLLAALGWGWPLQRMLAADTASPFSIQIALGIAAMFVLVQVTGSLGVLQLAGGFHAWSLIIIGIALLVTQHRHFRRKDPTSVPSSSDSQSHPWLWLAASPAIAVLLLAACSAPGSLWATEFAGYDVLSYHLQLPKEWMSAGRIQPFEHNVYSFLPGYVEGAYYHLAVLAGDPIDAAYASQLLHALVTIVTAIVACNVIRISFNHLSPFIAGALFLGTPWVIVVGSLAYNEMPALLMLAAGLIVLADKAITPTRCRITVGILAGAACGAKLTAAGMVAMPLLAVMCTFRLARPRLLAIIVLLAFMALILSPYLVRNALYSGNPVFPFATTMFGTAHWTVDQVARWNEAHLPSLSISDRAAAIWHQFLAFGIGPNPSPGEPWKLQWSILPWLSFVGLFVAVANRATRSLGLRLCLIIVIQLVFWLFATHLKSRFLLFTAVPMSIAVAIGLGILIQIAVVRFKSYVALSYVLGAAILLWCIQPILLYRTEGNGAPSIAIGHTGVLTGDQLSPSDRNLLGTSILPSVAVNHLLPKGANVLAIGYATTFYMNESVTYNTTWDSSVLAQLMANDPDESAAWAASLQDRGYTHLLIQETMLTIWHRTQWSDPLLNPERVRQFAEQHATQLFSYPDGSSIHQLN